MRKKIGILLSLLTALAFIGATYFTIYNKTSERLTDFFYILTVLLGLAFIIYFRQDIKKSSEASYASPANAKKALNGLIILLVGAEVINLFSHYIGGTTGFTFGLILGAVLLVVYFIYFSSGNKK